MASVKSINKIISITSPLDLVIYGGKSPISNIITSIQKWRGQNAQNTQKTSHVGIVISKETCPWLDLKPSTLYVWESTIGSLLNYKESIYPKGSGIFGVQIKPLYESLSAYIIEKDANVGICKLKNNPFNTFTLLQKKQLYIEKLHDIYQKYGEAKFDTNFFQYLSMIFPVTTPLRDISFKIFDNKELVCSEFIAVVYKELNILSKDTKTYEIFPADLASNIAFAKPIWLF
ncbi:hypothetical protein PV-S19_0107 [Pacmanvirus S19]|nr:hypothetical protein PV-S19_0107 [Pacmanvirus S19]